MIHPVPPLAPPATNTPVDFEAHLRLLPHGAVVKGVFFTSVLSVLPNNQDPARLLEDAGMSARRFPPVGTFSAAAFYRLSASVARTAWPALTLGEGLRRLGQTFYETFALSLVGRMVFGVLGRDAERIVPLGPKGWALSANFGEVIGEKLDRTHVRYHFVNFPGFIETMQVGVVEGALRFCRVEGRVLVGSSDRQTGVIDVSWVSRR